MRLDDRHRRKITISVDEDSLALLQESANGAPRRWPYRSVALSVHVRDLALAELERRQRPSSTASGAGTAGGRSPASARPRSESRP